MTQLTIVPPAQPRPGNPTRPRSLGSRSAMLERLARELDRPVEIFLPTSRDEAPAEPLDADASELLALVRHWLAIDDGQARRRVLSLARQEAERSGLRVCA